MRPDFNLCDICNAKASPSSQFKISTGYMRIKLDREGNYPTHTGPGGSSWTDEMIAYDLCPACLGKVLSILGKQLYGAREIGKALAELKPGLVEGLET